MRDDFSSHQGQEATPEFHLYPGNQPVNDISLSAIEIIEELEWLSLLDPGGIQAILKRQGPSVLPPETEAITFLGDLLKFGGVSVSATRTLTVNWGDGTPAEVFGPGHDELDVEHTHCFAKSGQYQVLIATSTKPTAPVNFCRLVLQVRNETGEVTVIRSIGLE